MMPGADSLAATAVSIILPTYNRAKFLPEALAAIRSQQWTDWELIVVDDGSTDETEAVVRELTQEWKQPVRYIRQQNQGAYGARNTGLDHARGEYIAFYDSDDLWLPHHLLDCVEALAQHAEVDWVYGACQRVDLLSGHVITPNTFYLGHHPRPFLQLRHHMRGNLRIIDDPTVTACMIRHGLYCGLQCSVMRASAVSKLRFEAFKIGEDQVFIVDAMRIGVRFGYFNNVHVKYRVHADNLSASKTGDDLDRKVWVVSEELRACESMLRNTPLAACEDRALRRRLLGQCFWDIGYALLWQNGRRQEAITMFRRGLNYWPWDWRCWKTYLCAELRIRLSSI
jgi:glycosyltransferase involved in cell wall biosynthesis